ncbi:MAG: ABC transporter permease [Candidatus Hydrothermarchaeota archaeon]
MAIYTLWLREMKRFIRFRSRVVSSLATPIFWLLLFGVGLTTAFRFPGLGRLSYLEFMAPGIVGMTLLFASTFAGVSVLWDRQFGFLKEIMVAPVSRTHIVLGKTIGGATTSLIQGGIMLIVTLLVGIKFSLSGFFIAFLFMILISIGYVAFGLIFAAKMEDPHGFQMIMSFLIMPMFFLSGALFPLDRVPHWLRSLSCINPLTYGVDGMRGALIGNSVFPLWTDFIILVTFCLITISLASYFFEKTTV